MAKEDLKQYETSDDDVREVLRDTRQSLEKSPLADERSMNAMVDIELDFEYGIKGQEVPEEVRVKAHEENKKYPLNEKEYFRARFKQKDKITIEEILGGVK